LLLQSKYIDLFSSIALQVLFLPKIARFDLYAETQSAHDVLDELPRCDLALFVPIYHRGKPILWSLVSSGKWALQVFLPI